MSLIRMQTTRSPRMPISAVEDPTPPTDYCFLVFVKRVSGGYDMQSASDVHQRWGPRPSPTAAPHPQAHCSSCTLALSRSVLWEAARKSSRRRSSASSKPSRGSSSAAAAASSHPASSHHRSKSRPPRSSTPSKHSRSKPAMFVSVPDGPHPMEVSTPTYDPAISASLM